MKRRDVVFAVLRQNVSIKMISEYVGTPPHNLYNNWRESGVPKKYAEKLNELYLEKTGQKNPCLYRPGIECTDDPCLCDRCGWNPVVEKKRMEARKNGLQNL